MSDDKNLLNTQSLANIGLASSSAALTEQNTHLRQQRIATANEQSVQTQKLREAASREEELQGEIDALELRLRTYQQLLRQPLAAIAESHEEFKANYLKEQENLADWMVSQKSYKELAINLGKRLGMTIEEVLQQGSAGAKAVLTDQNAPEHNTIASNSNVIRPHIEALLGKLA